MTILDLTSEEKEILGDTLLLETLIAQLDREVLGDTLLLQTLTAQLDREVSGKLQNEKLARLDANPDEVEQGLAKLVLTLIELIRQLLERQAIRRVESGNLTDDQVERMGETFIRLEARMQELKLAFGLQDEELNINLGPLGNLL